jgi:multicomponent Na+:H+ antiporter subunit C
MSLSILLAIGGLTGVGIYLITARSLSRIVLGFALLGHAAVLGLLVAGGPAGQAPLANQNEASEIANPIPQALALTAIVISFGLTLFLLALARRQQVLTGDDLVEDDLEDRRIVAEVDADEAERSAEGDARMAEAEAAAAETATASGETSADSTAATKAAPEARKATTAPSTDQSSKASHV